jgi:hypothetical protein
VAALVLVLFYGGVVHVFQLATGGWPPYRWAPPWLAIYYTALTALDPLTAVLLFRRRVSGCRLAAFVLVTDAAANWYATYRLLSLTTPARISQAVISVLAVAALVVATSERRRAATV